MCCILAVFVSATLPKLSACVHAAVALLIPFSWQNIFVPILPQIWLDYLTAPMPFVVGIHSSLMETVERMISNGAGVEDQIVFVMLDTGTVELRGFEASPVTQLPPAPTRRLQHRLAALLNGLQQGQRLAPAAERRRVAAGDSAVGSGGASGTGVAQFGKDVLLAFAVFMASIFGHYPKYVSRIRVMQPYDRPRVSSGITPGSMDLQQNKKETELRYEFDVDSFLSLQKEASDGSGGIGGISIGDAKPIRRFLKLFRGSQMFERFCLGGNYTLLLGILLDCFHHCRFPF